MSNGIWTYRIGKRFIIMKPPDLMKTYKMTFEEYSGDPDMGAKASCYSQRGGYDDDTCAGTIYQSPLSIEPSDVKGIIENILAAGGER